ncbi:dTMP kinase [Candidatus Amesbacteria bacterium RIFCSPHIGHO2_01_FULL_48_32]|uniref:Thymidylate kinase n=1 Tax=Candidatus Amesbacteria bacterium RIFCSPLOWO2_01_FULL_48_25 TaxID=1797259 RepID=A0A1F4ZDY8_9BACT|nr:MAG: dTMP kinase [Candidatus Amesbacteria bacterium RIFCSPHIGHO2_01_FULL_48_32]OGD03644.1 MAG: dTMP kinase [Candidatus Amesbacteria bacterium RIFCSPLOWO2_01_FULL_48_25]HJZ06010.1 dTMP kinase [Patescibacteria group bacterium]
MAGEYDGYFITFEGPDGSGKSTQSKLLVQYLGGLGYDVMHTFEPGGTKIGEQVRNVLHDMRNTAMQPRAEALGYLMSRAQLMGEKIRPRLAWGGIVVSDRYNDSTLAYQGYGHGLDLDMLRVVCGFATGGLTPDLTLLLDLSVEEGLERRKTGGGEWNRLDAMDVEFHGRVRGGYLEMARQEPDRWVVIDAKASVWELHKAVRVVVQGVLGLGMDVDRMRWEGEGGIIPGNG